MNRKRVPTVTVLDAYLNHKPGASDPIDVIEWATEATPAEVRRAIRREAKHGNLTLVERAGRMDATVTERGRGIHRALMREGV